MKIATILIMLTLSSTIFANDSDEKMSYIFRNAKLSEALAFALEVEGKEVVGYKNVPDLTIKLMKGHNANTHKLSQYLLECGRLKLFPIDYYYQITVDDKSQIKTKKDKTKPSCNIFTN